MRINDESILTTEGHNAAELIGAMGGAFEEAYPEETWRTGLDNSWEAAAGDWIFNGDWDEDDLPTASSVVEEWMETVHEAMQQREVDEDAYERY